MFYRISCSYDTRVIQDDFNPADWSGYTEEEFINHRVSVTTLPNNSLWLQNTVELDEKLDSVFVVYVLYTSGGTFGCTRGYFHFIGMYAHQQAAEEAFDKYCENADYLPWDGYFESLDSVEIDYVRVKHD